MSDFYVLDVEATGRRISELRKEKHIKVERLAELLGLCSVQAVYKWQRGDCMPTVDNLVVLSGIFEVPIDSIVQKRRFRGESESSLLPFSA